MSWTAGCLRVLIGRKYKRRALLPPNEFGAVMAKRRPADARRGLGLLNMKSAKADFVIADPDFNRGKLHRIVIMQGNTARPESMTLRNTLALVGALLCATLCAAPVAVLSPLSAEPWKVIRPQWGAPSPRFFASG